MNTAAGRILVRPGTVVAGGYAIPIARASDVCAAIVAGKASATVHIGPTAYLGVTVTPSAVSVPGVPAPGGAGVISVPAGTPAAAVRLAFGDVIVSLDGRRVTSAAQLRATLVRYHPGSRVLVRWVDRARQPHATFVVLAEGPAA